MTMHIPAHKQTLENSKPAQFSPGEPAVKPYGDMLMQTIDDCLREHNMPTMSEVMTAVQVNDADSLIASATLFNQRMRILNRTGGTG